MNLSKTIADLTRSALLMKHHVGTEPSPAPTPAQVEPKSVGFSVGFGHRPELVEQERVKINEHFDNKYGEVEQIGLNDALLTRVSDVHQFLLEADIGPKARDNIEFLYTSVNALIADVLQLQELNNALNMKVRDLTLEMVKGDITRGSFRG